MTGMGDLQKFATVDDRGVRYEILLPNAEDDYIQKLLRDSGKPYELEMLQDMASRLHPGDLVLDIGANIGNHALYVAALTQANVIAFEPNTELAEALARSVQHNGFGDRVTVEPIGLGRQRATARFREHMPSNLGAQSLAVGDGDIIVVPADEFPFPGRVRMMKIDVEGMEMDVLEGAGQLVKRDRPLLYVESQDEKMFRQLSAWAIANGYAYWETFNISPTHLFRPAEEVELGERLERWASREVIQEYRYNVQLRRARRFQKAAEENAASLKERITELEKFLTDDRRLSELEITRQQVQLGELQAQRAALDKELAGVKSQLKQVHRAANQAFARINEIQDSTLYQFSQALAGAMVSWRGLVLLPWRIASLLGRGARRRLAFARVAPVQGPASLSSVEPTTTDFLRLAGQWIEKTPQARGAVSILYADINVNVVDGSSIWLSSMASLLCAQGPCILVSKATLTRDVVVSNIRDNGNLLVVGPDAFEAAVLSVADAVQVIRALDALLPKVRLVVVRGLDAASTLFETRQFDGRIAAYLTDFFAISGGQRETTPEQLRKLDVCATHARFLLVQTAQIRNEIRALTGRDSDTVLVPPVIPNQLPKVQLRKAYGARPIKIGYAGKVNSRWGVVELLDWTERLASEGVQVELHIVADKISNGPDPEHSNLKEVVPRRMRELGARHYAGLNREASMALMARMDFVWCWRPPLLEGNTLELSTKLIEMVASGARCICFPNDINQEVLGEDYPYFARSIVDLRVMLGATEWPEVPEQTAERLRRTHGLQAVTDRIAPVLLPPDSDRRTQPVVFSGHDFKFIDAYVSHLKRDGVDVMRDAWEWGAAQDLARSTQMRDTAEVVVCEWGLANAVWYSKNLRPGQRLFVRIHAQEVRQRAQRFGREIDISAVEKVIFVSSDIRDKALELWGWPVEKTVVIPNYVLDAEFTFHPRRKREGIVLGMLGIVPQLKRLDRAIDLLEALIGKGTEATLRIKGHRPEELPFMTVPGREQELAFYRTQYERIAADPKLAQRVVFEPWGNDVAKWYQTVDVILSCSETESFHYALADGVLSGCFPVVWPWAGAERTYDPAWIVRDLEQAVERVEAYGARDEQERERASRLDRALVVERYGANRVFAALDAVLLRRD